MRLWWVVTLLGLVACDPPKKERPPPLEGTTEPTIAEIREWLKRTRKLELNSVDCPPTVVVQTGGSFTCTAIATDGSAVDVVVEFVDRSGVTKMTLSSPIVVAAEAEAQLLKRGGRVVNCGKRIRRAKAGSMTCVVDGQKIDVVVGDQGELSLPAVD